MWLQRIVSVSYTHLDVYKRQVLEISAVSATFFQNFSSFWTGLGSCFRSFMDYSYPRPVSYQPVSYTHLDVYKRQDRVYTMDVRKMRNELLGKRLVAALESRNMEAYYVEDVYKRQP